jgi:hypothetical protein
MIEQIKPKLDQDSYVECWDGCSIGDLAVPICPIQSPFNFDTLELLLNFLDTQHRGPKHRFLFHMAFHQIVGQI